MSFAVMNNPQLAAELPPVSRDSTIEIPAGVLAGCAKCAETSDVEMRYVLNVVRVEASGRNRRAIAMDGRQAIVAEWKADEAVNDLAMIPRDACTSRLVERAPDGVLLETNHERRLANLYVGRDDGRRYGLVAELVEGKVSTFVPPLVQPKDVLKPTKSKMFRSCRRQTPSPSRRGGHASGERRMEQRRHAIRPARRRFAARYRGKDQRPRRRRPRLFNAA